jgi:hypothetical protein
MAYRPPFPTSFGITIVAVIFFESPGFRWNDPVSSVISFRAEYGLVSSAGDRDE